MQHAVLAHQEEICAARCKLCVLAGMTAPCIRTPIFSEHHYYRQLAASWYCMCLYLFLLVFQVKGQQALPFVLIRAWAPAWP